VEYQFSVEKVKGQRSPDVEKKQKKCHTSGIHIWLQAAALEQLRRQLQKTMPNSM